MKPKCKRPKKIEKTRDKIKRKKYDPDSIKKALQAIENGMSQRLAAKTYQVPRTTIIYQIKNPDHNSRPGPSTVMTEKEEKLLVDWIDICCRKGFPKRKEDIISSVSHFLKNKNKTTTFKNGEKWFKLFLRRHPNICFRTPEAVSSASAAISENDVRGWFRQIEEYLRKNNLFHILSDPSRVYNGDETNFLLCPKTGVVLAQKGTKNVYEVDNAPAKTALTVMFTFGANGSITPPMVIFPNKRLSTSITSTIPPDWGIGLSDNGWMKSEIFHDYIESVLYPSLVKAGVQFPIILFVDGHKSHLTYMVSELCEKLNIVLIALYPNCTRLLQPADVSAFKPLKHGWKKSVLEWRRTHPSEALTKVSFVPLLEKTIQQWISPSTVINGFRATGLFPWNVNSIDYSKCIGKSNAPKENQNNLCQDRPILLSLEEFKKILGDKKLTEVEQDPLKSENVYLKKIWDFFQGKQTLLTNELLENTDIDDDVHTQDTLSEFIPVTDNVTGHSVDVANMRVIIANEETLSDFIPVTNEVEIEYTDCDTVQKEVPKTSVNYSCSQNIQALSVVHKAEVYEIPEKQRTFKDLKKTPLEITTKIVNQHDYDKLDVIEDDTNPKTHFSISQLTPVKLQDVLLLPKTPQRKGQKNIKRAPFVLTSAEWKALENEKIKIKEEKAEGIKKRKEEREKKLQEKTTLTKKKTTKQPNKKENRKNEDLKKLLLSDKFYSSTIDISLKSPKKQDIEKDNRQNTTTRDKRIKQEKTYTTEEIEQFLTEFEYN